MGYRQKTVFFITSIVLFLLLLIKGVYAIGISNYKIETPILFEPNLELSIDFIITDYGHDAFITIGGDLARYTNLSDITEKNHQKFFTASLKLPESLEPGFHTFVIEAKDIPRSSGSTVGGLAVVQKRFTVRVLNNSKSIEAKLNMPNFGNNESSFFHVNVQSIGAFDINNVSASVDIIDSNRKLIRTILTDSSPLKSGEGIRLQGFLNATGFEVGDYNAKATVFYDGESIIVEGSFRVGSLSMYIDDYTKNLTIGTINKFQATVRSGWNKDITNVYAEIMIANLTVKTATENIEPFATKRLETFIDSSSLALGSYDTEINLYYQNRIATAKGLVAVIEKPKTSLLSFKLSGISLTIFGIGSALLALLIINIVIYYKFIKVKKHY